ncbi:MAG TPA: DUF4190 domain-containing protein [Bacteroidia bacterium]|nr:DUF4190 domain-containing protein [Bacteroidia bacterium]
MEQNTTSDPNAGKSLGVAGLVVGIISLIFSFIPCLGAWAFIPAIVGIILSAVSMKQAGPNGSKGMAIGGLICAVIAVIFACYWLYLMFFGVGKVMDEIQKSGMMDSLDKAFKQMGDSMNKAVKILEEVKDTTNKQ